MSKWLKKDSYEMFADQKSKEVEQDSAAVGGGFYKKWRNPAMGTTEKAKEYKIRLLPDVESGFYKDYLYHGFNSGEIFKYFLCEKTFGMDHFCPWCEATKMLYRGNESDKRKASDYKRKQRFVSNIFIAEDPRDVDVKDDKYKVGETLRLYEFPATVESKIKNEITDTEQGYGMSIFDPESGYDFILKVKAKPKDKNGKEWPDYGDSMFARRASPIADTDDDIEKLMEERVNLDEYIKSLKLSMEDHEKLLKAEMLWDDVGNVFEKIWKGKTTPTIDPVAALEETDNQPESIRTQTNDVDQETPNDESSADDMDDTDALLEELQNI